MALSPGEYNEFEQLRGDEAATAAIASIELPLTSARLFGSASSRGIRKDIYIAVRTDGLSGTGTAEDPFDASTTSTDPSKYDNLLIGWQTAGLTNIRVMHGPGDFYTLGTTRSATAAYCVIGEGWIMQGCGPRATRVILAPAVNPASLQVRPFATDETADCNGVEIRDMCVDGNYQNITSATKSSWEVGSILLWGNHCRISNVWVKNGYGSYPDEHETFMAGILATLTDGSSLDNIIENSLATDNRGTYCHAFMVIYDSATLDSETRGGYIKNCAVIGQKPPAGAAGVCSAYYAPNIIDNYAEDCQFFFRSERSEVGTIAGNTVRKTHVFVRLDLAGPSNPGGYTIRNNDVEITDRDDGGPLGTAQGLGITWAGKLDAAIRVRNLRITGNTFRVFASGDANPVYGLAGDNQLGGNLMAEDNIFDTAILHDAIPADMYLRRNRTVAGASIAGLPDT